MAAIPESLFGNRFLVIILKKELIKKTITDIICILIGTLLMVLGMVVFTIPNNLAPGGVSGLATALHQIIPLSIGLITLIINVPIFIIAWRRFGFRSLVLTGIATLLFSFLLDIVSPYLITYTGNRLLASIFGGVLLGAGIGMMFVRGVTSGGTDLISMIMKRPFPQIPSGTMLVIIDSIVILIAVLIFKDIEVALYSTVTIFVQGKVIDAMQQGIDYAKIVLIITEKPKEILQILAMEKGRGVTEFTAKGGFSGKEKTMLLTVARRSEISDTLRTVKQIDPRAFTILHDATEVHGEGFKEL